MPDRVNTTSAHRTEVTEMKRKTKEFLKGASRARREGGFTLSCFLYEQAVQLFLKSELLARVGDFPRTHSLRALLGELSSENRSALASSPLNSFIRDNRARLSSLEDAYILARYSGKEYSKEDADDASNLAEEVMGLVSRARGAKKGPRK